MHLKASAGNADVVMLDLEDSVPVTEKETSRELVIRSIAENDWSGKILSVRTNSIESPFGYRDLLEIAENVGHAVDTFVIPKIGHPGDIHFADRLLSGIELRTGISNKIGIEASIETAGGLERISEIADASDRIRTLVFGIADYAASVGARMVSISGHGEMESDIYPGHRWHYPMSRLVMAAKCRGILAIDAPYGSFKDPEGLKASAAAACAIGFDGKWAIHPDQISIINQVFSPAPEDIRRARLVLDAFAEAQSEGRGAVAVEGRMVDQATVRLAQHIIDTAKHLNLIG
jgi:citrate lyase beta subunit